MDSLVPGHVPPRPADAAMLARQRERWRATTGSDALPGEEGAFLDAIFGASPFLSDCAMAAPETVHTLFGPGPDAAFDELIAGLAGSAESDAALLMRRLRQVRRRAALVIAAADLMGWWNVDRVCLALSAFADAALRLATQHVIEHAVAVSEMTPPDPAAPGLLVLALGKLGARELNYSSDIDLIALYEPERLGYRGRRSPGELAVAMVRELTRLLAERTEDGYVFRVDWRLRPDPGAMPLAISVASAETYYEAVGQNWERAAMIKARAAAGDLALGVQYLSFLRRFIWRKHLDFAAIRDIHSIKRQIDAYRGGGRIKVAGHDVKVGRGGIREIEFFVQTQQLIRGGREPALRTPRTLDGLAALAAAGHITGLAASELARCYRYLRVLEHRLQMIDDRQTQTIPDDPARLAHIATFMGYDAVEHFDAELRRVLGTVERHYAALFEDAPPLAAGGNLVFTGADDDPATLATLRGMGYADPVRVCAAIRGWHRGRVRATRSARARELLTEITPELLAAIARAANPDAAFARLDHFLAGLPLGVPLFSLFQANPALLELLAGIMADAPRLAELLSRKPILFDAVLDRGYFGRLPGRAALHAGLEATLADAGGGYEVMLDALRRWADEQRFRIGLQALRGSLDAPASAAALTEVADAVLRALVPRVEAEFAARHGRFPGGGLALVALGRMGSGEMTAQSDLDLVLVYDPGQGGEGSDGAVPLSPGSYYARLAQRLIAALTARTAEGVLYEVDFRLRPSGNAGPIATSLEAFRRYHRDEAWTWENMALTRARTILGPSRLRAAVGSVIRATLRGPRDPTKLRADVADMRRRIAETHRPASGWDVRYRAGGIVDIDFLAQYLALRHPACLARGSAAILARARALGVLGEADADAAESALALWSTVGQIVAHALPGRFDPAEASAGLRARVAEAAGLEDFAALEAAMETRAAAARAVYDRVVDGTRTEDRR